MINFPSFIKFSIVILYWGQKAGPGILFLFPIFNLYAWLESYPTLLNASTIEHLLYFGLGNLVLENILHLVDLLEFQLILF